MGILNSIDFINKLNNKANKEISGMFNEAKNTIKGGGSSNKGNKGGSSRPSSGGSTGGGSSSSSSSSSHKGSSSGGSSYRPSRGDSYSSSSDRAYEEYQKALEEQRAAAEAAQKAKVDAAVSKLEGQRPSIYQNAEAAAKQAYINKMLAQRDMAQQMTASGLSGGLSDSALIAMNSDYENSRNSILQNQSNALNELNTNINQVKAGGDLSLAEMQSQYQAALAQQAAQELQRQQELQNQMDLLAYKAQLEREAAAQATGISAGGAMRQYSGRGNSPLVKEESLAEETVKEFSKDDAAGKKLALQAGILSSYGRAHDILGESYGYENSLNTIINWVKNARNNGEITSEEAKRILQPYGISVL